MLVQICVPSEDILKDLADVYRLLNVNCEIFGTSSYGEGHTSSHMAKDAQARGASRSTLDAQANFSFRKVGPPMSQDLKRFIINSHLGNTRFHRG